MIGIKDVSCKVMKSDHCNDTRPLQRSNRSWNTGVEYATDEKPLLRQTREMAVLGKVDGGPQ